MSSNILPDGAVLLIVTVILANNKESEPLKSTFHSQSRNFNYSSIKICPQKTIVLTLLPDV